MRFCILSILILTLLSCKSNNSNLDAWDYDFQKEDKSTWQYATIESRPSVGLELELKLHQADDKTEVWLEVDDDQIDGNFVAVRYNLDNPINYGLQRDDNGVSVAIGKTFVDRVRASNRLDIELDTKEKGIQVFTFEFETLK